MDLPIEKVSRGLKFHDGVWVSEKSEAISYPDEGNDRCFELEEDSFWFKHRNRVIESVVKRFSPHKTLFDLGGGNGYVCSGLEKEGYKTVLVEPGSGVENAKKRGLKNLVKATFRGASFKDSSLPSLGMFDVLEHMENDKETLTDIHRKLEKDGLLYLTVPSFDFLWSEEDITAGHFRRYTRSSLNQLLSSCGFKVLYSSYFFTFLPPAILLFRSLPYRFGVKQKDSIKKEKSEHTAANDGLASRALSKILATELTRIDRGQTLPWGSSIILVASKDSLSR